MSLLHRHKHHHDDHQSAEPTKSTAEGFGQPLSNPRVQRRRSSGLKFFASSIPKSEASAEPTRSTTESSGELSSNSKNQKRRSSGLKSFPFSVPKPDASKVSHKEWEADYLKDLRANRPARPGGSRPLPGRAATYDINPYPRATSAMSFRPPISNESDILSNPVNERSTSALSHRRAEPPMGGSHPMQNTNGRPLARPPEYGTASRDFSASTSQATSNVTSGGYRESGMRWLERQEARSLREALDVMDSRDEVQIHAAAQDEASELVLKHRKEGTMYKNPSGPYNFKQHLEKGAHARSQSIGWIVGQESITHQSQRSVSDGSASNSNEEESLTNSTNGYSQDSKNAKREIEVVTDRSHELWDSPSKKAYMGLISPKLPTKPTGRRRSSGPRARDASGGLFRNPNDKIYEEPNDRQDLAPLTPDGQSRIPAPLASKPRNIMSKMSVAGKPFTQSNDLSVDTKQRLYRSEIHKNTPSQSRDPSYKKNETLVMPAYHSVADHDSVDTGKPLMKDGKEIRSDDIRAATSMRMKDRSPKLPSPTIVSNRPGRPIVSFERDWRPKDKDNNGNSSPTRPPGVTPGARFKPQMPASTASAPIVPTINVPEPPLIHVNDVIADESPSIPSISVSETPIPTISLPEDPPQKRPLPSPTNRPRPSPAKRPLPHHSSTTPVNSSKLHWSASSRRATAQCAACALPIEGRIVSAAAQRFHPHCFSCYHCAEALECVAFYPEPDSSRHARLARIEARANGTSPPEDEEKAGETAVDDGDSSLRFYCHLDFHELFSPRCRSCKTPIESEVVLACGASWHVGHFFCAQCGDPFDAKTPFVEKDGYAWCVGCHAGRFSEKCKGCRKPVVDGGLMALGGEWHAECFCCVVSVTEMDQKYSWKQDRLTMLLQECGGQFADGRFFTRGGDEKPVCVQCEERRLKA